MDKLRARLLPLVGDAVTDLFCPPLTVEPDVGLMGGLVGEATWLPRFVESSSGVGIVDLSGYVPINQNYRKFPLSGPAVHQRLSN